MMYTEAKDTRNSLLNASKSTQRRSLILKRRKWSYKQENNKNRMKRQNSAISGERFEDKYANIKKYC